MIRERKYRRERNLKNNPNHYGAGGINKQEAMIRRKEFWHANDKHVSLKLVEVENKKSKPAPLFRWSNEFVFVQSPGDRW